MGLRRSTAESTISHSRDVHGCSRCTIRHCFCGSTHTVCARFFFLYNNLSGPQPLAGGCLLLPSECKAVIWSEMFIPAATLY
jgi:hypothetical protein